MEYTVKELSQMAGVSARTLRYYDQIGLLRPARVNPSGYRIYGREEVDRLQQILFYRELGVKLSKIKEILAAPSFDAIQALQEHREKLLAKRKAIRSSDCQCGKDHCRKRREDKYEGSGKFEGFKQKLIAENEKFGREARERYGTEAVEEANRKLMKMTKEEYEEMTSLEREMRAVLAEAVRRATLPASWPRGPPGFTGSGYPISGPTTARKPTPAWPKCMSTMIDSPPITTENSPAQPPSCGMPFSSIPKSWRNKAAAPPAGTLAR